MSGIRRTLFSFVLSALWAGCSSPEPVMTPADAGRTDAADAAPDGAPATSCTRVAPTTPPPIAPDGYRPTAAVDVLRDGMGIPHIYGRTDEDVFFASGYMQATDRLFQMEIMRRSARGTAAEVIGREKLAQDQLVRMVAIPYWGHESAERARRESPEIYRLTQAWVSGVNRRVREVRAGTIPRPTGFRPSELDFEPQYWTVDDPFLVSRLLLFRNASQLDYDLLASLVRQYAPQASDLPIFRSLTGAFILPPEERPRAGTASAGRRTRRPALPPDTAVRLARFLDTMAPFARGASNNWAVAGRHTFNGRPLLAGDPHQSLQSPTVFWAQHLNSAAAGGTFDVVGFAFVGAPGVHLGHNRHVGWTATTTYPDWMDVWQVPQGEGTITLGGRTYPVTQCMETISVKGEAPVQYTIEDVPGLGVLLPTDITPLPLVAGENRMLFRWTGFRPSAEADVFFTFDRAADTATIDAAVQRMEIGAFNFVGADAHDIVYRSHVITPDRGDPRTMVPSNTMLDGTNPRTLWGDAMLSADRQPHSRGGTRGFLFSANNDPFGFTANGRIDDDPWYYGVWFDPGTRGARIEQELTRLTTAGGITVEQMEALQFDAHSVLADELIPVLDAAWGQVGTNAALASFRGDARLAALAEELHAWDRRAVRDSSAAVVFEGWVHFFARGVVGDDMGAFFDAVLTREPVFGLKLLSQVVNRAFPTADRFMQEGREFLALSALALTRDWLTMRFGGTEPARYRWDGYHRSRELSMFGRASPFDVMPVATDGTIGTVNVSQAQFFDMGNPREFHESHAGAAYRMVISFNEDGTPTAVVNFPRGNVGDPSSPFWGNTDNDWVNGTYRPLLYARSAVEADVRERIAVMP